MLFYFVLVFKFAIIIYNELLLIFALVLFGGLNLSFFIIKKILQFVLFNYEKFQVYEILKYLLTQNI